MNGTKILTATLTLYVRVKDDARDTRLYQALADAADDLHVYMTDHAEPVEHIAVTASSLLKIGDTELPYWVKQEWDEVIDLKMEPKKP